MTTNLTATQTDEMQQYLQDVNRFDSADREMNQDLARRCAEGDRDAISQMVNANLRLVISVVFHYYRNSHIPMLDLCQEGNLALIEAVKTFDHTRGTAFSTYAQTCIYNHLNTYCKEHAGQFPVSEYTGQQIQQLKRIQGQLREETGSQPSLEALSSAMAMPEDKVRELLMLSMDIYSLDKPLDQEDTTLGELKEDTSGVSPEAALAQKELQRILAELIDQLDPQDQTILRLRFGLEDGICHTLRDIADRVHLSNQRVDQRIQRAITTLRTKANGLELGAFLDDSE